MPNGPRLVHDSSAQTQREYPGAKPNEIATLIVGGRYYSDWETFWCGLSWLHIRALAFVDAIEPKHVVVLISE